ncbi:MULTISPECIES: hypothetical protein [Chitinophagaceae]
MGVLIAGIPLKSDAQLPSELVPYISQLHFDSIGQSAPVLQSTIVEHDIAHIVVSWDINTSMSQDDVEIRIKPSFDPVFYWAPHLTPTDSNIIAQHVFRSPALIMQSSNRQLCLVPDLDLLKSFEYGGRHHSEWYLDMDAQKNQMVLGMGLSTAREHVLFYRKKGASYAPGRIRLGFYLFFSKDSDRIFDPWERILNFYWNKWGASLYKEGEPLRAAIVDSSARQTYRWAFHSWEKNTWQNVIVDGDKVGAPTFIVNVTQSPNWKGVVRERETRSIWNQAWFNSLRSAMGLYRYAKDAGNDSLLSYALKTKQLALDFPNRRGFFYSVVATEMDTFHVDGTVYGKSKGWNTYYWGNSNRNPFTWDIRESPFHVLDMSYTAYLMLCWYSDLEKDPRLLRYALQYAKALLKVQEKNGFFPAWLDLKTLKPMGFLDQSPESAMSVSFLLKLYRITGDVQYKNAAAKTLGAIIQNIVLQGKWEDFETYWSCSRYGADSLVGKRITRNNMYKQNTLSMYYTAQALYSAYQTTKDLSYLKYGKRVLDEMLMYQASWQPPYMYVSVLGGFGVMNGDAEWNDSRQSLFAELIVNYGLLLKEPMYIQRGMAALKASFVMMYSPWNNKTKEQWQKRWPFLGKEDYGFMMENYGHDGVTAPDGSGIGEFTIYDWGNGAASEAYFRMRDHFGEKWLTENLY